MHEHQVTVCGNDVPAYFLRRAWDFGKREVAPRHGRLRLCPIFDVPKARLATDFA